MNSYPEVRALPSPVPIIERSDYDECGEFSHYYLDLVVVEIRLAENLPVITRQCKIGEHIKHPARGLEPGYGWFTFDDIPSMLTSIPLQVAIKEVIEKVFAEVVEEVRVASGGAPRPVETTYQWAPFGEFP
jgi:hypothetical protein